MPILGTAALVVAFGASLLTMFTGALGGHLRSRRYTELSRQGVYVTCGAILISAAALLYSFVTDDFSLPYVHGRSDLRMPVQYVIAAFWGGQEGSLLFWVTLTTTFGAAAAFVNRARIPRVMPYYHAVLSGVTAGLLFILIFVTNPFVQFNVMDTPLNGVGLNPLLQNPLMTIHPPTLLAGFATFAVPYSFGMAALLARDKSADPLRATRKWTLISWLLLSVGNILGGMWAYQELGWGGYWGWDPVENAALIPWFAASAYLHSVIIQEQRGMFRKWNAILVSVTFLLTVFGTWMTRSGLVQSVHTFAASEVGDYFLVYLIALTLFSIGLIWSRWTSLVSDHRIDSPVSREGAFMLNNWLLCGIGFVVLWGTLFPKIREMATGTAVSIGPAWFNKFTTPLGLALLGLMALGTLLPWRRVTVRALRKNFTQPVALTLVLTPALAAAYWIGRGKPLGLEPFGYDMGIALTGLTLIIFNTVTIVGEFYRGIRARMRGTGTGPLSAMSNLFARHRRRYGGYVVHTGVIMIFLAFFGNVGKVDLDVTLHTGETVQLGDYEITFDEFEVLDTMDKREIYASMTLWRNGNVIGELRPARYDFNDYSMMVGQEPDMMKVTSEIFIRSTPLEDVYVALLQFDRGQDAAAFKMVVLPFTWWFWFGGIILVAGTMICMWPDEDPVKRRYWQYRFGRRLEVGILAGLLAMPVAIFGGEMEAWAEEGADHGPALVDTLTREQVALVNEAFSLVMTTCNGCAGKSLATASPSCYPANQDKQRIRDMAASGMGLDDILGVFVDERGERALAIPPDSGVNRLAWIIPSAAIVIGIFLVTFWARTWSRDTALPSTVAEQTGTPTEEGAAPPVEDGEYIDRLEDELAALDA